MGRTTPARTDSIEKLVHRLACFSPDNVTLGMDKAPFFPDKLQAVVISPTVFRTFVCQDTCHACCQRFTLDYYPGETHDATGFSPRAVWVNGERFEVWTEDQTNAPACPHLQPRRDDPSLLGCDLWPNLPIECSAAPQLRMVRSGTVATLGKQGFSRGWRFDPPAQCLFPEGVPDWPHELALLRRYLAWANYLHIPTTLPEVIERYESLTPYLLNLAQSRTVLPLTPAWRA